MNLPKGHQTVMPYLMLPGAAAFLDFMKTVFGATEIFCKLREDGKTVMHSEIDLGGSTIMFCEATEDWPAQSTNLFVYVVNADETYHKALAHGATSLMALTDQDYGRTCGITDPFGNVWWITAVNKTTSD